MMKLEILGPVKLDFNTIKIMCLYFVCDLKLKKNNKYDNIMLKYIYKF
jgi:hypothetical protein